MRRVFGLAAFAFGVAALAWLARAAYPTTTASWHALTGIGMPLLLLLVLFASSLVGLGLWLMFRRPSGGRRP